MIDGNIQGITLKTRRQIDLNKALIKAAAEGRSADFAKLVCDGAQLDGVEESGTPLIAATVHNQPAAVDALLVRGARVDVADHQGKTAIMHAINARLPAVVQRLAQVGADLNAKDAGGNTALTHAAGKHQQEIVDDLIALHVDVNITNTAGVSALMRVQDHKGIVRSLLDAKADLSHAANKNALTKAVINKNGEVAQMLLQAGAKLDACDFMSRDLLTHAVVQKNADLVRSLIAANADPNHSANNQALVYALESHAPDVLKALLDAGARPDLNSFAGQKAVITAFAQGNIDAVARWYPAPADTSIAPEIHAWDPLPDAVAQAPAEIIDILRDAGYSIKSPPSSGHTLLMSASHLGRASIVDRLLQSRNGEAGADPNAQQHQSGKTALMFAAEKGCSAAMQSLLAAGADPSAVDHAGRSVWEYANQCQAPGHKFAMKAMLSEAMIARTLGFAKQLQLGEQSFDELLERELADAVDDYANDDTKADAAAQWHEQMNDIDASPCACSSTAEHAGGNYWVS